MAFARTAIALLVLALASTADAGSTTQRETPIRKVISIVTDLKMKLEKQQALENARYQKDSCDCKEQKQDFEFFIQGFTTQSEDLAANIKALTSQASTLSTEISDRAKLISDLEQELQEIRDERAATNAVYNQNSTEVQFAIADIKGAKEAIQDSKDNQQGTHNNGVKVDLASIYHKIFPHRVVLGSFLQTSNMEASASSKVTDALATLSLLEQKPAGYEFRSNDILGMLESLKDTYLEVKTEMDQSEQASLHDFELNEQGKENQKRQAEKEKRQMEKAADTTSSDLSQAEKDKAAALDSKANNEDLLSDLTARCEKIATDYDEQSKKTGDELDALTQSLHMLQSKGMQAESAIVGSFLQEKQSSSNLRANRNFNKEANQKATKAKAVQVLLQAAKSLKSQILTSAMLQMEASRPKGDFSGVRKMIEELIFKVQKAMDTNASMKQFCDKNLKKTSNNIDTARTGAEGAQANVIALEAEKDELTNDIAALSKDLATVQKLADDETKARNLDKDANANKIETARLGIEAVEFAIKTLEAVFASSGESFLQTRASEEQQMKATLRNVVGNLQTILADFETTIQETGEKEADEATEDERILKEFHDEMSAMQGQIREKESRIADADGEITELKDEIDDHNDLNAKATEEMERLKTLCLSASDSFKTKQKKAEQEIEALKTASQILEASENATD